MISFKGQNYVDQMKNIKKRLTEKLNKGHVQHDVWVLKFLDFSEKYGIGYQLSNGLIGVLFNDLTKLVLDPNNYHLDYFELDENKKEVRNDQVNNTLESIPDFLVKKMKIMVHLGAKMKGIPPEKFVAMIKSPKTAHKETELDETMKTEDALQRKVPNMIFVMKWIKTRHALMFRLSNNMIQSIFDDGSELMYNSWTCDITYVNKRGEKINCTL